MRAGMEAQRSSCEIWLCRMLSGSLLLLPPGPVVLRELVDAEKAARLTRLESLLSCDGCAMTAWWMGAGSSAAEAVGLASEEVAAKGAQLLGACKKVHRSQRATQEHVQACE